MARGGAGGAKDERGAVGSRRQRQRVYGAARAAAGIDSAMKTKPRSMMVRLQSTAQLASIDSTAARDPWREMMTRSMISARPRQAFLETIRGLYGVHVREAYASVQ